jgi:hypothetical protein
MRLDSRTTGRRSHGGLLLTCPGRVRQGVGVGMLVVVVASLERHGGA